MATSGQQAGYAASKGLNWADPSDPNFGQPGYIGQADYDAYTQQYGDGGSATSTGASAPTPTNLGPLVVDPATGTTMHQPAPAPAPTTSATTPSATSSATPFPSLPAGATPPPGYVDPLTGQTAPNATTGTLPGVPPAPGLPAVSGQPPPAAGDSEATSAFLGALMKRLNPGAVDQNNPAIAGAIAANNLALQRGAEAQRAQLAEQNAQEGTDASGGANTGYQGILEDMAARQGQFAGGAVQHLNDLQNQEAMQTLGILSGYLPEEQKIGQQGTQFGQSLAEQQREADVEAALKKLGITSQADLGKLDLELRDKLGSGQLGLGLLSSILGFDTLGQNAAQSAAGLDQQTLLSLLSQLGL